MPQWITQFDDTASLAGKTVTNLAEIAKGITQISGSVTRPADTTAYASGDLLANSTTAGSVTPITFSSVARINAGSFDIVGAAIRTSSTSVTNAAFRLHFYRNVTITCANGDNGAWSTDQVANYLGFHDVTVDKAFTDGAFGFAAATANLLRIKLSSGTGIVGLIEVRGSYTPTSAGTFTVVLDIARR